MYILLSLFFSTSVNRQSNKPLQLGGPQSSSPPVYIPGPVTSILPCLPKLLEVLGSISEETIQSYR